MPDFFSSLGGSQILLQLCFITLGAFLVTRITKLMKLPNVTGYILCGILIGPYVLGIIPTETVAAMDFVTDIALALIAFGVGKYMKLKNFRGNIGRVLVITLFETLTTMAVVTLVMRFVFKLDLPFSLLIGAIGASTAPASTIMNIRTLKAKGEFVETTVQVIAIDNLIAIIAFSISAAIVQTAASSAQIDPEVVLVPIIMNIIGIAVGFAMGFVLKYLLKVVGTDDSRLVLTIASVIVITYVCSIMDISPLLASMSLGATYINITEDKKLYKVSDVDLGNYDMDEPVTLAHPLRIRIPNEVPLSLTSEFTVRYTDTDLNGHMNNTNYPNMLVNALPNPEKIMVKSLAISFLSDIKAGESVKIYMAKTDGKHYFRSVKEDGTVNIEAEMITELID